LDKQGERGEAKGRKKRLSKGPEKRKTTEAELGSG